MTRPFVNATDHAASTAAAYLRSSMLFTGLAVTFMLVAVLVGGSSRAATRPWVAALLAMTIVAAQFALLMSS